MGERGTPPRRTRREAIAAVSATAIAGTAGCMQPLLEEGSNEAGPDGGGATEPVDLESPWEFRASAPFRTPPVLEGGTLYAGNVDESLYAIDAATGDLHWTYDVGDEVRSVTVDDGTAFVTTTTGLFAVDVSEPETLYTVENRANHRRPLVTDDTVYAVGRDTLSAVDRSDGSTQWSFEALSQFWGRPALADGVVLTSDKGDVTSTPSDESTLYGIDAETGEKRWETPYDDDGLIADVAVIDDTALFSGRYGTVAGVDVETGEIRWSQTFEQDGNVPRPFYDAGDVFVGMTVADGDGEDVIAGLDPDTGETRWSVTDLHLPRKLYEVDGAFYGAPWNTVLGVDPDDGELVYRQSIEDEPFESSGIEYRPTVTDTAVYLCEGAQLHAFERANEVEDE